MLNRRTLRIKAMQTIFAFRQSRLANYGIAIESLEDTFKPDLNSMEVQDPAALKVPPARTNRLIPQSRK